ncbi:hypothetical protein NAEGRDRAFT_59353 [Naegleria gruberi]|uniref:Protein kinase domain-containing protein n=1 Tax=Naegleria gruberi TaxID=5762 RepID=D2VVP6_NAEGR|nr:uncharacterized protein NAEGRDRAFT_59353 [Naegleria gruberi]EFC39142.1 hypothetical protein NAEGRDRAFT_59353 [Naegleria gruberi]|eukprot:XP_002671886.1 hypothetical protein NAEGRDRAFT_59353 [Naegleria gruberi strain NEG-M]
MLLNGNSPVYDNETVYFFTSVNDATPHIVVGAKEFKQLNLMEFKTNFEKLLDEQDPYIARFYYLDDSKKEIVNIANDDCLKEMWQYFDTTKQQKKIFFDYETRFILNYLQILGYGDLKSYGKGQRSHLYTALWKGKKVVIKITKGPKKEVKREVEKVMLLENCSNIISYERAIEFMDAYDKDFQSYMGYHMVFYPNGDLSNIPKPLSEISFLIIAMRMASIIEYLQQMEHVHYDLKLSNFLIGSKVIRGYDVIYDPILIDLEYAASLTSLIKSKETLTKSKIQNQAFAEDLKNFGDCLLELYSHGENWKYQNELKELINKIQEESSKEIPLNITEILKSFTIMAFTIRPEFALEYNSFSLANNKNFMQKLIEINPIAFKFAHETLRKEQEFVEMVLEKDVHLLKYVHSDLTSKTEFMEKYIRKDGLLLQYAAEHLKWNKDFVKIATDETACAIMHVTNKFDGYIDLLKECLKRNPHLLEYALEKTIDIVLCAVSQDPITIGYATTFKNHPEIQQAAKDFYCRRKHKRNDTNILNTSTPSTPTLPENKKQRISRRNYTPLTVFGSIKTLNYHQCIKSMMIQPLDDQFHNKMSFRHLQSNSHQRYVKQTYSLDMPVVNAQQATVELLDLDNFDSESAELFKTPCLFINSNYESAFPTCSIRANAILPLCLDFIEEINFPLWNTESMLSMQASYGQDKKAQSIRVVINRHKYLEFVKRTLSSLESRLSIIKSEAAGLESQNIDNIIDGMKAQIKEYEECMTSQDQEPEVKSAVYETVFFSVNNEAIFKKVIKQMWKQQKESVDKDLTQSDLTCKTSEGHEITINSSRSDLWEKINDVFIIEEFDGQGHVSRYFERDNKITKLEIEHIRSNVQPIMQSYNTKLLRENSCLDLLDLYHGVLYCQSGGEPSSTSSFNESNNNMMNPSMLMMESATTTSSLHPSASTLTFSSSSSSDESTNNQHLANLLSNLMNLNQPSPVSLLLDNLTNNASNSSTLQSTFPHVQYSTPSTNKMANKMHPSESHSVVDSFNSNHHILEDEFNMLYPIPSSSSTCQEVNNNIHNDSDSLLKSFNDQTWSCMDFETKNSAPLIKAISPSMFKDFMHDDQGSNHIKNSNISLKDATISDLFQSNSHQSTTADESPNIFSMYGISSLSEMQTSELITPLEYSNNNLLEKQQIVEYYSSLLQSRFQQVFGNAISEDVYNSQLTTQQFVYYDSSQLTSEQYRKPLNLKLDLSDAEIEIMRSLFGKQTIPTGTLNRKCIQASRKNSVCSSGSIGKQITKASKTKGSPSRKGRKCQPVPNNFSPLNEETGNWRFFSYNGDVKEPFSLDQESPSKLVFYKFNPVK